MAFSEPTYRVPRDFYASEKYAESRVEVNPNTGPDGRPYGVGRVGICVRRRNCAGRTGVDNPLPLGEGWGEGTASARRMV
jgi:hypothetical protein